MTSAPTTLSYVHEDRRCIGTMLARGKVGIEAFDADDRSLGLFPNQQAAADAIVEAAKAERS
jgi:hypothetical protein